KPKRVIVLTDDPTRVVLSGGLAGEVKANSRENFLALADTPPSNKGSQVVFAWGHGGMQKTTPVFHVRGPRITPDDFKKVADAHSGESRWLLFFRGSGSFAKALCGDGREIVATE